MCRLLPSNALYIQQSIDTSSDHRARCQSVNPRIQAQEIKFVVRQVRYKVSGFSAYFSMKYRGFQNDFIELKNNNFKVFNGFTGLAHLRSIWQLVRLFFCHLSHWQEHLCSKLLVSTYALSCPHLNENIRCASWILFLCLKWCWWFTSDWITHSFSNTCTKHFILWNKKIFKMLKLLKQEV